MRDSGIPASVTRTPGKLIPRLFIISLLVSLSAPDAVTGHAAFDAVTKSSRALTRDPGIPAIYTAGNRPGSRDARPVRPIIT